MDSFIRDAERISELRIVTGIIVDRIETEAMDQALANNQTIFGAIETPNGNIIVVRIFTMGEKQLLRPALFEDFRRHGIRTCLEEGYDSGGYRLLPFQEGDCNSIVQITIPFVVHLKPVPNEEGDVSLEVHKSNVKSATYVLRMTLN